jgi:hypothetical protein
LFQLFAGKRSEAADGLLDAFKHLHDFSIQ